MEVLEDSFPEKTFDMEMHITVPWTQKRKATKILEAFYHKVEFLQRNCTIVIHETAWFRESTFDVYLKDMILSEQLKIMDEVKALQKQFKNYKGPIVTKNV